MMRRAVVLGLIGPLVAGTLALASPRSSSPAGPREPAIDPANFVRRVTNPFFPLVPGSLWVYRGLKDGATQIDRVFVTHHTKSIVGIHATVVRDVATQHGRVIERTFDWYAQDKQGNVWYLGEDTTSFENGNVSKEGSWETGVHGAVPGIIMEADPQIADGYRQEFWK